MTALLLVDGGSVDLTATLKVPPETPFGLCQGRIEIKYGENDVVIPVTVTVAASGMSFSFGQTNYANGRTPLYDNENVFGYTDYSWREESGDWRFFWTDVMEENLPASGDNYMVVDNYWMGDGTDIDTILLGPAADGFSPMSLYEPYTLAEVARSVYTYIGSGRWLYQTSSGSPREIIAGPVQDGLHGILLQQVKVDGELLDESFYGKTGLVNVDPGMVSYTGAAGMGSQEVTISTELDLTGFVAEGFGLGNPVTTTETINQDDPDDVTTASFVTTVDVEHGAKLEISTCCTSGSDIDLFVYDPYGNLVGSSTTSTDEEFVSILFPEDGTYTIAVHGWSVPSGTDTFELTINAVQGYDVSVTNLPDMTLAGTSGTITVE